MDLSSPALNRTSCSSNSESCNNVTFVVSGREFQIKTFFGRWKQIMPKTDLLILIKNIGLINDYMHAILAMQFFWS